MLIRISSLFFALFISTASLFSQNLLAGNELPDKGVMMMNPWSRPAPPVAVNGAAYVSFHNMGPEQDKLIGARSDIADRVEIHDHIMENGLMKMHHIEDGLTLNSGEKVELEPGGKHLMLLGLNKPLVEGESFQIILQFENAGEKSIEVKIQEKPAAAKEHGQDHGDGHDKRHSSHSSSHDS